MKRLLISLCVIASPVWAEQVNVRSGDHAEFSRLVFDLPPDLQWEVIQGENYVRVELGQEGVRFNLDNIFNLIPKTRILDIEEDAGGSSVQIKIASGLSANYFPLEDGSLVLDIGSNFEKVNNNKKTSEKPAPSRLGKAEVAAFTPFYQRSLGSRISIEEDAGKLEGNLAFSAEGNARQQDAELNLMYQIGRAAAQGLIEIDKSRPKLPAGKLEIGSGDYNRAPTLPFPQGNHGFAMNAKTAIDGDNSRIVGVSQPGVRCLSDDELSVSAWLDDAPIIQQISNARRQLLGEFDAPSPDAVEKLAKVYIASGFGAEAISLLETMPTAQNKRSTLESLAAIIDDVQLPVTSDLPKMTDCDTNAALWALLASDASLSERIFDFSAVKRAFSELPSHLRVQLGPRTIDRLLSLGAIDAAESVRNSLKRTPDAPDETITLVDLKFTDSMKPTNAAVDALIPLMASNGVSGHEALLRYIETRIRSRQPIDDATIQNAAALAYEHRGRSEEFHFLRAYILGLGSVGKFGVAFNKIQTWPPESDTTLRRGTIQELFRQLSEVPNDRLFLTEYFFHQKLAIDSDLPAEVRLNLANRLVGLGFSSASEDILSESIKRSERGRTLLARAAIIDGELSEAISYLDGIETPEGIRLLATAHSLIGDHVSAREAFDRLDDHESSSREARRSGNFEYMSLKENGEEPKLSENSVTSDENEKRVIELGAQSEIITLEKARMLLNSSEADREFFSSVLLNGGAVYDE